MIYLCELLKLSAAENEWRTKAFSFLDFGLEDIKVNYGNLPLLIIFYI